MPESLRLLARSLPQVAWERWMPICGSRSPHAVRPQRRRILHQLPHLIDFARARFARVPLRDIFEALVAEQGPSFEHFIHPVARRLQGGADRRIGPSLRVQIDNSAAALVRIGESPQRVDSASWSR